MASVAEREIRDALVDWWHKHHPRGRVVHELPLSSYSSDGRADLGIIFPDTLVLVEIKSERDKLTRLEKQFNAMQNVAHGWQLVLHEKWFDADGTVTGQDWMNYAHKEHVWKYPDIQSWNYDRYKEYGTPNSYGLLNLLWRDELADCYSHCGMSVSARGINMFGLRRDLHNKLTGRQVRLAVCDALRSRTFSEADPAITTTKEALL